MHHAKEHGLESNPREMLMLVSDSICMDMKMRMRGSSMNVGMRVKALAPIIMQRRKPEHDKH
jgi:hypothetical protein